jgi:hypothetical protein
MANGSGDRVQSRRIFMLLIPLVSHSQIQWLMATLPRASGDERVAVSIKMRVLYCAGDKRVS